MEFDLECPATRNRFSAKAEINGQFVARHWGKTIDIVCPLCRQQHAYDFKQHYVAAAMASMANQGSTSRR